MWLAWRRREIYAYRISVGNLTERDNLVKLGLAGMKILKWILNKLSGRTWTRLAWLSIGTDGGLL